MGEKRHGLEKFVPPKPLYVESDTTGDARPPVVEYLARHYRSQYDLEKIKVYNNHAMDTCYNLPLEDVTEHFETPCVSEAVSSLNSTTDLNKVGSILFNSGMKMTKNAISGVNKLNNINVSSNNLSNVGSISFQNGDTIPRVSKTIYIKQPILLKSDLSSSAITYNFDLTKNPSMYTQVGSNNTAQPIAYNGPLKSGDLIYYSGNPTNMPIYLQFKTIPSDVSSFYFVANGSRDTFLKTESASIPVTNGVLYTFMKLGGKLYAS